MSEVLIMTASINVISADYSDDIIDLAKTFI